MKKILPFIMMTVLLLTMVVPTAAETGTATPTIYVTDATAAPGGELCMEVCIRDNPGITAINLQLSYPTEVLELIGVSGGTVLNMTGNNPTTGKVLLESADPNTDVSANGTLFTVRFRVRNGAGKRIFPVSAKVLSAADSAAKSITFAKESGNASVTTQTPSSGEENSTGTQPPAPGEENSLPAGAIAGIIAGSVLIVGAGGFAIFWFGIRKKGQR